MLIEALKKRCLILEFKKCTAYYDCMSSIHLWFFFICIKNLLKFLFFSLNLVAIGGMSITSGTGVIFNRPTSTYVMLVLTMITAAWNEIHTLIKPNLDINKQKQTVSVNKTNKKKFYL